MTSSDKNKMDLKISKFFFACNVPFNAIESKYFKDIFADHLPLYETPSRRQLSGTLLNTIHKEQQALNAKQCVEGDFTALLIDGWKNSAANRKYAAVMVQNNRHKIFLDSFDITNEGENAITLLKVIETCVNLAKERYGLEVVAVVTDNVNVMTSMGRRCGLMSSTCNSHTANLLVKDIIESHGKGTSYSAPNVLDDVREIQTEFKRSALESKLISLGGSKPKLPCNTRWGSQRGACVSMQANLLKMKQIAAEATGTGIRDEKDKVKPTISALLFKEELQNSIETLLELLNPVSDLIDKCQQGNFSIADSTEVWIDLIADASYSSVELYGFATERCVQINVFNKFAITANYLHVVFQGSKLSCDQIKQVDDFLIKELDGDGLNALVEFQRKDRGIFSTLLKKTTDPIVFWQLAKRKDSCASLANLAIKLLNIPASTAQIERVFSNWADIHSKKRNRLSEERSKKLLGAYFSLKMNQGTDLFDDITDTDTENEE